MSFDKPKPQSYFQAIGKPILILSHPRSGTHMTIDFIRRQFPHTSGWKLPWESVYKVYLAIEGFLDKDEHKRLQEEEAKKILLRSFRPIIKAHVYSLGDLRRLYPDWMEWIDSEADILYVYRDVRKVMLSNHVYMQSFYPPARTSIGNFIRQDFATKNRITYWRDEVEEWINKPGVMPISYEFILNDTVYALKSIQDLPKLDAKDKWPLLPPKVESLWLSRVHRFTSIKPSSTAIVGYTHSKNLDRGTYTKKDLEFIYERAGDMLKQLGYL